VHGADVGYRWSTRRALLFAPLTLTYDAGRLLRSPFIAGGHEDRNGRSPIAGCAMSSAIADG
jgi:hypothetical protein